MAKNSKKHEIKTSRDIMLQGKKVAARFLFVSNILYIGSTYSKGKTKEYKDSEVDEVDADAADDDDDNHVSIDSSVQLCLFQQELSTTTVTTSSTTNNHEYCCSKSFHNQCGTVVLNSNSA